MRNNREYHDVHKTNLHLNEDCRNQNNNKNGRYNNYERDSYNENKYQKLIQINGIEIKIRNLINLHIRVITIETIKNTNLRSVNSIDETNTKSIKKTNIERYDPNLKFKSEDKIG